jgi:hypothetical protein
MTMNEPYLEVTFRHGRPLAAYYYLPRRRGDRIVRTEGGPAGLVVDYTNDGRAIGIEITAPSVLSLAAMNRLLKSLGQAPVKRAELLPVLAA